LEPRPVQLRPGRPDPGRAPDPEAPSGSEARPAHQDAHATVREWRELAELDNLSLRQVVAKVFDRAVFVGTPTQVAGEIDHFVQQDACDGFILGSHVSPSGLDEVVDRVIPLLRERGAFRTEYRGTTLREHLGLAR